MIRTRTPWADIQRFSAGMMQYVYTLQHRTNCLPPPGLCGCHVQPTLVESCNMRKPLHGRAAVDRLRHFTSFQIPKHHLRQVRYLMFRSKRLPSMESELRHMSCIVLHYFHQGNTTRVMPGNNTSRSARFHSHQYFLPLELELLHAKR